MCPKCHGSLEFGIEPRTDRKLLFCGQCMGFVIFGRLVSFRDTPRVLRKVWRSQDRSNVVQAT